MAPAHPFRARCQPSSQARFESDGDAASAAFNQLLNNPWRGSGTRVLAAAIQLAERCSLSSIADNVWWLARTAAPVRGYDNLVVMWVGAL